MSREHEKKPHEQLYTSKTKLIGGQLMPEFFTNRETRERARYDLFLKKEFEISAGADPKERGLLHFRARVWPISYGDLRTLIAYETDGKRQSLELPKDEDISEFYRERRILDELNGEDDVEGLARRLYTPTRARRFFLTDVEIDQSYESHKEIAKKSDFKNDIAQIIKENREFHGRQDFSDAKTSDLLRRFDILKGTSTRRDILNIYLSQFEEKDQQTIVKNHADKKGMKALTSSDAVLGYADWQGDITEGISEGSWVFGKGNKSFSVFLQGNDFYINTKELNWRIAELAWTLDKDENRIIESVAGEDVRGVAELLSQGVNLKYEIPGKNSSSLIALGIIDHFANPRGRGVVERYLFQDLFARRNNLVNSLPIARMEEAIFK